jgi:hypothetical protein
MNGIFRDGSAAKGDAYLLEPLILNLEANGEIRNVEKQCFYRQRVCDNASCGGAR